MEFLKDIFGTDALTYEQLAEKLKDNKDIKLGNLATGAYVSKDKFTTKETELNTANNTIKQLQDAAKAFDGVDVNKLKNDMSALQTKYDTDIATLKMGSAVDMALVGAKVKNPKLVKAALDMSVVKMDGDKLLGLSDQLENLKKSDAYLFEDVEDNDDKGGAHINSGANHNGNGGGIDPFTSAFMKAAGITSESK